MATAATHLVDELQLRFTSFDYVEAVQCDRDGNDEEASPSISWSSANAVAVYWTPKNNNDATAENGYEVGASGNKDDMSASKVRASATSSRQPPRDVRHHDHAGRRQRRDGEASTSRSSM